MTLWLVVPAAGRGTRMHSDVPKQYLHLHGRSVLAHTLDRLYQVFPSAHLILCLDAEDSLFNAADVPFNSWQRVTGGDTRAATVANALQALTAEASESDWVLVHDAARPCVSCDDLEKLKQAISSEAIGALLAAPVADTMKRSNGSQRVMETVPRDDLWHALTPQVFRYELLRQAMDAALATGTLITDESSAIESLGLSPQLIEGSRDNIKITRPNDLITASRILSMQRAESAVNPAQEVQA